MLKRPLFVVSVVVGVALLGVICYAMSGPTVIKKFQSADKQNLCTDSVVSEQSPIRLPDTMYSSVSSLFYKVECFDTVSSPLLEPLTSLYDTKQTLTFRGSPMRDMPQTGVLDSVPSRIDLVWSFRTDVDTRETKYGVWGGGSGWTGQPLYVCWPDSIAAQMAENPFVKRENFSSREIIIGSLCGKVYFLNFDNGQPSREPIKVGNPIKGTPSLDPRMNGYLYVGQGVPAEQAFGAAVYNLFSHQRISFFDRDYQAWRSWGAYDSSPIVAGGFVFRPGENGTIYKLGADGVSIHSLLRYRAKSRGAAGVEASMAVFSNYGFISDNHGNILCINLDTMHPVWRFDNCDDTDATPVLDVEQGRPVLYVGSAVDKQGNEGYSHLTKIDALTGEFIWQHPIPCQKIDYGGKLREGGMFSTPLMGRGDCEGMMFANFCGLDSSTAGALLAIDKQSGKILYRTPLHYYSWSSPVAFTDAEGRMYIVTGDVIGYIYLIEAKSGRIIYSKRVAANFESSPVVVDDCVVVGSRGNMIYKFQVK